MKQNSVQSKTILITGSKLGEEAKKILTKNNFQIIYTEDYASSSEIAFISKQKQIDGLIVRKGIIDREVINSSNKLKIIVKHGVGYNNIDIDAATNLNIPVLITVGANSQSVAEHVLTLMLVLFKRILLNHKGLTCNRNWNRDINQGEELYKKNVGIIGFGRIGSKIVDLLKPLQMNILVFDPFLSIKDIPKSVKLVDNLELLLKESDIISVNCPLNKDTFHLLGKNEFLLMKKNSYIINTSRGEVIDENALIDALQENRIAGAGIDVFEMEPPNFIHNKLLQLNNVVTTPHIAGITKESFDRMGVSAANMIVGFFKNGLEKIEDKAIVNLRK